MYMDLSISRSNSGRKPRDCGFFPECPPGTDLLKVMANPAFEHLTAEDGCADTLTRWRGRDVPNWRLQARIDNAKLARRRLEETTRRVRAADPARLSAATPGSDESQVGTVAAVPFKKGLDPVMAGYLAIYKGITTGRKQTTPRQPIHRRRA